MLDNLSFPAPAPAPSPLPVWSVPAGPGYELVEAPGRTPDEAFAAAGERLLGTRWFPIPGARILPALLDPDHAAYAATEAARRALEARAEWRAEA